MTLLEQLNVDLKTALKAGDEVRKGVLRQVLAGVKQAVLDKRTAQALAAHKAQPGELTEAQLADLEKTAVEDSDVVAVLQKEAKSRRESMAEAEKANRPDLVSANEAELKVLEHYLPQLLTRAALVDLAQAAIAESGVTDAKGLGAVMKLLAPRTKGRADGKLVNEVVRELLTK
jgi:uncharacterized protein YqeY